MITEYQPGILTCHHCGRDEARVAGGRPTLGGVPAVGVYIRCWDCGACSPHFHSDDEAKEAWNRTQRALEAFDQQERRAECVCGIVGDGGQAACAKFEDPDPGLFCMGCQHTKGCHR